MKKKLPVIGEELVTRFSNGELVSWTEMIHDKTGLELLAKAIESFDDKDADKIINMVEDIVEEPRIA